MLVRVFPVVWWIIGGIEGIPLTRAQTQNVGPCSRNWIRKALFLNYPVPPQGLGESEALESSHPGRRAGASPGPQRRGTKIGLMVLRSYLGKQLGEGK